VSEPLRIPGPLGRRPRPIRAGWVRSVRPFGAVAGELAVRSLDLLLSLAGLVLLSPFLLLRGVAARLRAGAVFDREPRVGRFRTPFERLRFAGPGPGAGLAVLLNVLRGDMGLAGPRPLTAEEAARVPASAAARFQVRPGVVSPHSLRKRTGVAYETEDDLDRDFVYGETLGGDVGLLARSVPAAILGSSAPKEAPPSFRIFGIPIVNTTMDEALDWVVASASSPPGAAPAVLAFVNPDCLNIAYKNAEYRDLLLRSDRVLPDGIGIHLACRMLGTPLLANVNGTDMFPRLCGRVAGTGHSIFLLGARPGIAAAAGEAMRKLHPGLKVAGTRDGYYPPSEEAAVIDEINRSGASILLVAMGAPRQETWIARHRDELTPPVRMGVGGLFDFYSGRIQRAPAWMREIGLEWVYRLLQEPGRMWRRYIIGNPVFLFRVWKESRKTGPEARRAPGEAP
jgi:N-acetylglucosaminyldiphosphoundecaprenol N-acetyl-beta-D-mannosaminyltransferase